MNFLRSCVLNILGIIIMSYSFNITYSTKTEYLAMILSAIIFNVAGKFSCD